jgi:hypothetical protein
VNSRCPRENGIQENEENRRLAVIAFVVETPLWGHFGITDVAPVAPLHCASV